MQVYCCIALLFLILTAPAQAADTAFHPPQTEAERALDKILRSFGVNDDLGGFIFDDPGYNHARDQEFSLLFTQDFLNRYAREEKAQVKKSCGGKYPPDGRPCDMLEDNLPIYCGNDHPDDFLYRTIKSDQQHAIVTYRWPDTPLEGYAFYRFINDNGVWKLDDIKCRTPS